MTDETNIDGIVQETATTPAAPSFAPGLDARVVKFNFKSRDVLGEDGKPAINPETQEKIRVKQPSLEVALPVPSAATLIGYLQDPTSKISQLILDSIADTIKSQAKSMLDEAIEGFGNDTAARVSISNIDFDKLSLEYISSIEPARRASAVQISEEEWKDFGVDYVHVMQAATGKEASKLRNAVDVYMRPNQVKSRKELLPMFLEQLAIYIGATQRAEDFAPQVDFLVKKFQKFLETEDKLVANAF